MSAPYHHKQLGREFAFLFLYQWEMTKTQPGPVLEENALDIAIDLFKELFVDENENVKFIDQKGLEFAGSLIKTTFAQMPKIDDVLSGLLKYKFQNSTSKIDAALLKLGAGELLFSDTPFKVVLNEIINLAKKFGGPESQGLINGVLDKVAQLK